MTTKATAAPHERKNTQQGDLLSDAAQPGGAPSQLATRAPGGQLAALLPKLEELDQFAEKNNLSLLTEGKGAFSAAISVADAIGQLKAMLTEEIMKPIMELRGSALGFKTDKDKDPESERYTVAVVRECFIEATLKGFKMVGNQSNIIAGRFYATKEGFEDFFLRQAKAEKFTDFRDSYSVPKITSENEAIVTVSATWKWRARPDQPLLADKIDSTPISIRVNKGQGADAILGKAKRKLLARIYSRVTGTVITEGDASEPGTVIDVQARTVAAGGAAGSSGANPSVEMASEEHQKKLTEKIGQHAEKANAWLKANNAIPADGTYLNVNAKTAEKILGNVPGFLEVIGVPAK